LESSDKSDKVHTALPGRQITNDIKPTKGEEFSLIFRPTHRGFLVIDQNNRDRAEQSQSSLSKRKGTLSSHGSS
jgi:hypothetical protein